MKTPIPPRFVTSLGAVFYLCLTAVSVAAVPMLQNGSFEDPALSAGAFAYGSGNNWTATVGAFVITNGYGFGTTPYGNQWEEFANSTTDTQTISSGFTPGTPYSRREARHLETTLRHRFSNPDAEAKAKAEERTLSSADFEANLYDFARHVALRSYLTGGETGHHNSAPRHFYDFAANGLSRCRSSSNDLRFRYAEASLRVRDALEQPLARLATWHEPYASSPLVAVQKTEQLVFRKDEMTERTDRA